jgi:hypothetical protein
VKTYVKQILGEFTRLHGKEVLELRPTLDAMADAAANNKPPASAGVRREGKGEGESGGAIFEADFGRNGSAGVTGNGKERGEKVTS